MKKEIRVDTPPTPLGTLEVAILDLAGGTTLQAVRTLPHATVSCLFTLSLLLTLVSKPHLKNTSFVP